MVSATVCGVAIGASTGVAGFDPALPSGRPAGWAASGTGTVGISMVRSSTEPARSIDLVRDGWPGCPPLVRSAGTVVINSVAPSSAPSAAT